MNLSSHIAIKFLVDGKLVRGLAQKMHPESWKAFIKFSETIKDENAKYTLDDMPEEARPVGDMIFMLLDTLGTNKNYYITDTVLSKLEMLKIYRNDGGVYDWSIFSGLPQMKKTFIFANDSLLRLNVDEKNIHFTLLRHHRDRPQHDNLQWDMFYYQKKTGIEFSDQLDKERKHFIDTFIYRLLCFIFLTENDEVILEAGRKVGTRKSGKIVNTLPFPITIVDSRWNTTVIRTEGFPVSGHFRLQRCGPAMADTKLIFIDPFQKHGYVRKAKS
jgi:hypothetical protein